MLQDRLAAYEDTGLWPEQVKLLQIGLLKEVNRLKTVAEVAEREGLSVARLQELAEADKDGRVVARLAGKWYGAIVTTVYGPIGKRTMKNWNV